MRLCHRGTESNQTGCPALYDTDRGTYVVQGWKVRDPQALTSLADAREREFYVEIPRGLLRYAEGGLDQATEFSRPGHPAMYVTHRGTYLIRGWEVTDHKALADLIDVREDEFYVEIPKVVLHDPLTAPGRAEEGT